MRDIVKSIEEEFIRYKKIGESALAQVPDGDLSKEPPGNGNSLAALVWHIAGNFESRFTDFLTTDGEKPWRKRDEEFDARQVTRRELLEKWEAGWGVLLATLSALADEHLVRTITIRGQALRVDEALHRSLAHTAYHCGQIVLMAKNARGAAWRSLSIPRGKSDEANKNPSIQLPQEHARALREGR